MTKIKPVKVLVVDDDKGMCESIATLLNRKCFTVDTCTDSTKAKDLADKKGYNLIILDISMPKIEGFDICKVLRRDHPRILVLMISGVYKNAEETKELCYSVGANRFLSKPFSADQLLKEIRYLMHDQILTLGQAKQFIEKEQIKKAIRKTNGDIAEVSRLLGVSRQLIYRKIKKHGLEDLYKLYVK